MREDKIYIIKDTWVILLRTPSEIYFLQEAEAAGVEGVPRVYDWEDVVIDKVIDSTDCNHGQFAALSGRVH